MAGRKEFGLSSHINLADGIIVCHYARAQPRAAPSSAPGPTQPAGMILRGRKIVTQVGILLPAGRRDASRRRVRQTYLTQSGRSAPPVTPGEAELSVQVTADLQAAPAARQSCQLLTSWKPWRAGDPPGCRCGSGESPTKVGNCWRYMGFSVLK